MESHTPERKAHSQFLASSDEYIHAGTSENTRKAYQSDVNHFLSKGFSLPATPDVIVSYQKSCATIHKPVTIARRLNAISQWHKLQNQPDPTKDPIVRKTMTGIYRIHGIPAQKAAAMTMQDVEQCSKYLKSQDNLISIRNRAMLLVGYFGALRRSELVSLKWFQIEFAREGIVINFPKSKGDQLGKGDQCAIPYGNHVFCPVSALLDWRKASKTFDGYIFRKISSAGDISKKPMTANYFNDIVKQLAKDAKLPNSVSYSAHSLRRGFTTESFRNGASLATLKNHGRWKSVASLLEYIDFGRKFEDNAAKLLLKAN